MTPFLRQTFLLLVALAALAIVLMMIATADAKDIDGTRQIVVEPSAQSEVASSESTTGAASNDLTEESGEPLVGALAEAPASELSEPEIQAEAEQPAISDREALARAYLYALYVRAAQRGHGNYGYSSSYSHGRSYDHCDD